MELVLQNTQNAINISRAKTIFNSNFNKALVHQVIIAYAAGARQGTRAQKNRAKVTGSGKKPWRQKGTGRARAGSTKSPIWRSGGVTFAASPRDYSQKINKKMYRSALKSIISELIRQDRLIIVDKFSVASPKTKLLTQKLKDIALEDVLIITSGLDKNLFLAARNLYKIEVSDAKSINPINLITFNKVLMTTDAIKQVQGMLT